MISCLAKMKLNNSLDLDEFIHGSMTLQGGLRGAAASALHLQRSGHISCWEFAQVSAQLGFGGTHSLWWDSRLKKSRATSLACEHLAGLAVGGKPPVNYPHLMGRTGRPSGSGPLSTVFTTLLSRADLPRGWHHGAHTVSQCWNRAPGAQSSVHSAKPHGD